MRAGAYAAGLARRQGSHLIVVFVAPTGGMAAGMAATAGALHAGARADRQRTSRPRSREGAHRIGVPMQFRAPPGQSLPRTRPGGRPSSGSTRSWSAPRRSPATAWSARWRAGWSATRNGRSRSSRDATACLPRGLAKDVLKTGRTWPQILACKARVKYAEVVREGKWRSTATSHAPMPGAHEAPRFSGMQLLDRIGSTSIYAAREVGTGRSVVAEGHRRGRARRRPRGARARGRLPGHARHPPPHRHALPAHRSSPTAVRRSCWRPARDRSPMRSASNASPSPALSRSRSRSPARSRPLHRAGLVHCAVRPQNILLTEFDEPVLADFGAAVASRDERVVRHARTRRPRTPRPNCSSATTPTARHRRLRAELDAVRDGRRTAGLPRLRPRVAGCGQPAHPGRRCAARPRAGRAAGAVRPARLGDEPRPGRAAARRGVAGRGARRGSSSSNGWLRTRMVTGEPTPARAVGAADSSASPGGAGTFSRGCWQACRISGWSRAVGTTRAARGVRPVPLCMRDQHDPGNRQVVQQREGLRLHHP